MQHVVQGAAVALALVVAFVPRRRTIVEVAALGAAVLIALQLGITHWFYLVHPVVLPDGDRRPGGEPSVAGGGRAGGGRGLAGRAAGGRSRGIGKGLASLGVRGAGRARPDLLGELGGIRGAGPVRANSAGHSWPAGDGWAGLHTDTPLPLKHEGCERRFRSNSATPAGGM